MNVIYILYENVSKIHISFFVVVAVVVCFVVYSFIIIIIFWEQVITSHFQFASGAKPIQISDDQESLAVYV